MSELALPEGWVSSSIGNVNTYKSKNITPFDFPNTIFELYSVPIFFSGYPEILEGKEIGSSKSMVEKDDVLICKINPRINRVWIVEDCTEHENIASSEWIVFRQPLLNPKFMKYYYQSLGFRDKLCADVSGVGGSLTRAKPREVANYLLPIASITEQNIISRLLDEHLTTVSQIQARLDAIPKLIEKFRQSVLNDAVSGRLTEDSVNFNSMTLGDLIYLQYGKGLPAKNRSGEGYPVYGSNGEVGRHQKYYTEGPFIIVGRKGSFGEITWSSESGWAIDTAYFVELRKQDDLKFIYYLLQTLELNTLNRSTAIPGLNRNDAYSQPVRIPGIEDQRRIVKLIEKYFTYIDQIEKSVVTAKARVDYLTQSILHQAFTGNLTAEWREQNPDLISGENSAEALLAKIKAEKQGSGKKVKNV
ncbi:restriction endonuclease subunit S [Psychrobacter piscatorii]|uniref:restriction endonuclease subunit S n=1 Tax=Psychrobacter piscatorii TaxID=554343 RepID=UPI00191B723B|nr:restriction endonuclease subunit S [Psychrobacter piscatorii]